MTEQQKTRIEELEQELRNVRTQRRRKAILNEITQIKGGKTVEDVRRSSWDRAYRRPRPWY